MSMEINSANNGVTSQVMDLKTSTQEATKKRKSRQDLKIQMSILSICRKSTAI